MGTVSRERATALNTPSHAILNLAFGNGFAPQCRWAIALERRSINNA
ncbi:MAG: hypothetical protein F6K40_34705 [Okeania sp. SIO3I5]|nr:hypothetical protein [Okeania sp. SIO3I5]NEQ41087.1 hypothetical protein [Okeania sp. SIO3I5]